VRSAACSNIEETQMAIFRVIAATAVLLASQIAAAQAYGPMPGAGPYGGPMGMPGPGGYGPGARPYGGGPFGGGPYGGGSPFRGMPFMQSMDPSRPDSFNPMRPHVWGAGPQVWMNPTDPDEGLSQAWDDMMNAPSRMGRVPPGWKAPTIDVPNPVDVSDEFEKNVRKAPYIIRDNFTFN
jgi:hypothetical protein